MIYSINDIKKILAKQLANTPVRQAILFGSYAKGCPHENSDIDIVIDMAGQHQNFAFWGIYEDLRNAFSIPVELFEKSEIIKNQQADLEIRQTGVIVYERQGLYSA